MPQNLTLADKLQQLNSLIQLGKALIQVKGTGIIPPGIEYTGSVSIWQNTGNSAGYVEVIIRGDEFEFACYAGTFNPVSSARIENWKQVGGYATIPFHGIINPDSTQGIELKIFEYNS